MEVREGGLSLEFRRVYTPGGWEGCPAQARPRTGSACSDSCRRSPGPSRCARCPGRSELESPLAENNITES